MEENGKCQACGNYLDVLYDNGDGTYIPKTLQEHQQDRLKVAAPMIIRNGKPVETCFICYKPDYKVCATSDGVRNDNETGVHLPTQTAAEDR